MYEINKLRLRLKNISRNATEYRMTIAEAKALVQEFESLESQLDEKSEETAREIYRIQTNLLDGGTF
jgi:hypothetical protein